PPPGRPPRRSTPPPSARPTTTVGRVVTGRRACLPVPPPVPPARPVRPSGPSGPSLAGPSLAQREGRLQVVTGVGPERDVGLGVDDSVHRVEVLGDRGRDLLVVPDPDDRDQVDVTRDRVHLADALDGGDLLGDGR